MTDLRTPVDDLSVMVAGQGGDGSLTVITLLSELLAARGFHLYSARNVASRIKGGHAAAMLRGSTVDRGCLGDAFDVLMAFDEEAVMKGAPRLRADGIVIADASGGPTPPGLTPPGALVLDVPFARMAVRDLRRDLFKNSLAFGVLSRVLSVPDAEAEATMRARFAQLPGRVVEANIMALRTGLAFADEHGLAEGSGRMTLDRAPASDRLLISGNEAIALGFLAAGGRFFTGYPITPASEILEVLEARLPEFGGIAIQAEDELSAVNMAIGAALTGTRAMTATSGPGIALMLEGVSHAGSAEIPLVIVDSQRAGPSTGMPTKPEQTDLTMLVHGGNGEFPRVVLAASDPAECFTAAVEAVAVSRRLQCPVFIAIDQSVAQHATTVAPFDLEVAIEPGRVIDAATLAERTEYRRYRVTEGGVSEWAVPGTPGGMSLVTGNEHNEWGQVSTDPAIRRVMVAKRARKLDAARPWLPGATTYGTPDAAVGVIGIGVAAAPLREAASRLAADGTPVAGLQPRTLWPVPDETVAFAMTHSRTYVVEHNDEGQLAGLLVGAGVPADRIRGITRTDGTPFRPADLVDAVMTAEGA